jgi:all-trans-retinol 13,14-reductase
MAGLAMTLLIVVDEYRRRSVKIMDCTSLGYFALAAALSATSAAHTLERYHVLVVWGLFAAVAWITLAAGFPFTVQYARESASREALGNPLFARINKTLTLMWAAIFTFGALLGLMIFAVGHAFLLGVAIPMSAMGVGYIFNIEYSKRFVAPAAKSTAPAT